MSEASKPTPWARWVWVVEDDDDTSYMTVFERLETQGQYEGVPICRLQGENAARLIAEAGTVHHETQCTPRQLVERVKELEEALRDLSSAFMVHTRWSGEPPDEVERARAALSKSLPNTGAEVK